MMLTWWPQSWLGDWVSHIGPWSQAHLKSGRTRNSLHGWPKKNTGIPSNSEKHLNFCLQSNGILILVDVWIWITNPEISVSKHPFFLGNFFFHMVDSPSRRNWDRCDALGRYTVERHCFDRAFPRAWMLLPGVRFIAKNPFGWVLTSRT
jgi:hypothetical protein